MLGPLEVELDGSEVPLAGTKQRAVLAILLIHRNRVVSTDTLIDELWGERPPKTAETALYGLVSNLRKLLERGQPTASSSALLLTRPPGYVLNVSPDQLDLDRFERLVEEGRRALADDDAATASARLREGLELWRGPPLCDVGEIPSIEGEIARLDGLRATALEQRIQADLALGRDGDLVGELEALVAREPLRERLRGQLMIALYRAGRQAAALEVYRDTRSALVDELGIEPGKPLQELQQAILRQDASLDAPLPNGRVPAPGPPRPRPKTRAVARPPTRFVVAILACLGAAAAVVAALAFTTHGEKRPSYLGANAIGLLEHGDIVAAAALRGAPGAAALGAEAVWVTHTAGDSVSRIDVATRTVSATIRVGSGPRAIGVGRGAVWVANGLGATVSRIDPKTNEVVQTIGVGNAPAGIAFGLGSVWVANRAEGTVSRIDARTGVVVETLPVETGASAIAVGEGAVWIAGDLRGAVARLDPGAHRVVETVNVGNSPAAIAVGAGAVWVVNTFDSTVSRINPRSNAVIATVAVGAGASSLAVTDEGIWVGNELDRTVSHIDPQTNRVDRTTMIGQRPAGVAASRGSVFVAVGPSAASHRGGRLTLMTDIFPASIDTVDISSYTATTLTNDGLTGFNRVGGAEGNRLVPDLALALPTPTDGGKTYTFRLRPGIRYSTGRVVGPQDFRRALERVFERLGPGLYYDGIVGARACTAGQRCDLSRGIVAGPGARTVTFKLYAPDPEFLFKLALPYAFAVPPGMPDEDAATRPLPATGPYMVASYEPRRELRLIRNGRFREWSASAQPDGYPNEIVWKYRVKPSEQVHAVESGTADVAFAGVPADRLREVETQYASQVYEHPTQSTSFLFLNTRMPPFDDVRVRRAVSYAVDRAAIVRRLGGSDRAQPTCQILPPNFPGYRRYCPFTMQPEAGGAWVSPDLAKARQLVAESGTRGRRVTVWVPPNHVLEAVVVLSTLKSLGYRARLKRLDESYYRKIGHPSNKIQAGVHTWVADYPAASNFINALLSCRAFRYDIADNANVSRFCDRRIDAQIARALGLQTTDAPASNELWAKLDRQIVDRAPVVPLVNSKWIDFVSERVGNYQYSPQWGVLVDQLWVR